MKKIQLGILLLALAGSALPLASAAEAAKPASTPSVADKAAAEKAWKELDAASRPPVPPKDWASRAPTDEEKEKFGEQVGKAALDAATKAKDFYTKYPNHEKAVEAQKKEKKLLETAERYGQSGSLEKLEGNPSLSEDEKFAIRLNKVHADALKQREKGTTAVMAEFEKGLRGLLKEYPKRPEGYQQLLMVAKNSDSDKAKQIYNELLDSNAEPEVKDQAKAALKVMGAVGRPFEISFTSVDGKSVDIKDLKGKVVLLDFWATWCGPCVAELPNVKKVYEKYHDQGFEILGISFDKNKNALTGFVKQNDMTWPQYFDGQGWGNKFGIEYNISAIPAMWLVDKNGLLQDLNAREDLEEKVAKYLAEK
jgi:thiol-disulfide isomerase/thioredoxin